MGAAITDPRFARIHNDPRFQRLPKQQSKVKVDKRFSALFTDKEFEVVASAPIDRQGKKATGRKTNRDAMRRRFELDEPE